ncbi:MAG: hypothetical protein ACLUNQ_03440 [Oscillospiraceae bacterium]
MTLGQWIPEYLTAYKLNTIRPDSYYTLGLAAGKIPQELKDMELTAILPMHLQRFVNDFGLTASKSYMDKLHVLLNALFVTAMDNDLCQKIPLPGSNSRVSRSAPGMRLLWRRSASSSISP